MKRFNLVLFVVILVSLFAGQVMPQVEKEEDREPATKFIIHAYNDHLYKISYASDLYPFNVFASVGEDGILLVDTGLPMDAPGLEEAIRSISDKPITTIIVTHTHMDLIGGIALLGNEATIVVSEFGVQANYHNLEPVNNFTRPVIAVKDSMTLEFNGEDIHLYNLPPGHFKDELYVYFEESNVICIGSRVIPSSYPYADLNSGCTIDELVGRIKIFAEMYPDAIIAPGHRDDQNAQQLIAYHKALTENIQVITNGLEAGKSTESLVSDSVLAPWDSLADYGVTHQLWINLIARAKGFVEPPAESVVKPLTEVYINQGVDAMLEQYQMLKAEHPDMYTYNEADINMLGYQLVYRNHFNDAKKVFELNIETFPASANTYDSLGELLLLMGDTLKAVESYRKAVEVDSTYQNAKAVLKNLGSKI